MHLSLYTSDDVENEKPRAYINLFNATNGVAVEWNLLSDLDLYRTNIGVLDNGDCETFGQVKTKLLGKNSKGICALGTWCELDISWDAETFSVTATSENDTFALDHVFTPSKYSPGPLMVGSGYVYGHLFYADVMEEGAIDAPSPSPTTASPTVRPGVATTAPSSAPHSNSYSYSYGAASFRALPATEHNWDDYCEGEHAEGLVMRYSYSYDGEECLGASGGNAEDSVMFFLESTSIYADPRSPGSVKVRYLLQRSLTNREATRAARPMLRPSAPSLLSSGGGFCDCVRKNRAQRCLPRCRAVVPMRPVDHHVA